ncbi:MULTISPECIES: hypothetical protein [Streptomyces]|uniref:Uncharacterized protein n=2 Tax=Streptomyces TaxID=1883 RepID=A0A3R7EQK0_9ACTN|nr:MULTISPECIES: hypothetical protein [Streptomyces]KNE83768.1 hypothetical protein ADZ36_04000 [Streptomyces fradiae]OFA51019.1 hypothetical protein BEN35_14675 [Streptomyces fradiae]PQM19948.1 hypothetical protein Sfr7A_29760 [Streptomyces xinghaiensis]RKM94050.1 hypothetical protein SFRA_019840 [Streptomyces xinghaiensis]RNC69257.1 hypothetical protein DC095_029840 [Streptomyces xinghaiensis]
MGFWGYLVVGRSDRELAECSTLAPGRERLELAETFADGWQLWQHPSEPGLGDLDDVAGALARETGAPTLLAYVMDGDCAVLEGAGPVRGSWTACLGRTALARHVGENEIVLDDVFPSPAGAAAHAAGWAAAAGRTVDSRRLADVLSADPDPDVEKLFHEVLQKLGIEAAGA